MKYMFFATWCVGVLIVGSMARAEDAGAPAKSTKERIGIYDSRALAVAFGGSTAFSEWVNQMRVARNQARAAGDQARIKEVEDYMMEEQIRIQRQIFSTEPVDNLLDRIKLVLPKIKQKAGVDRLMSKWDKKGLAKHPSAEQVDVTMLLVDAFHPDEIARKSAIAIQKKDPPPPPKPSGQTNE